MALLRTPTPVCVNPDIWTWYGVPLSRPFSVSLFTSGFTVTSAIRVTVFSERWWQSALKCSSGEVVFQGPPGPILTFLHPGLRPVHGIEDYVTQQEAPGLFFWDGGPPQGRGVQRRVVAADVCRSTNGG